MQTMKRMSPLWSINQVHVWSWPFRSRGGHHPPPGRRVLTFGSPGTRLDPTPADRHACPSRHLWFQTCDGATQGGFQLTEAEEYTQQLFLLWNWCSWWSRTAFNCWSEELNLNLVLVARGVLWEKMFAVSSRGGQAGAWGWLRMIVQSFASSNSLRFTSCSLHLHENGFRSCELLQPIDPAPPDVNSCALRLLRLSNRL